MSSTTVRDDESGADNGDSDSEEVEQVTARTARAARATRESDSFDREGAEEEREEEDEISSGEEYADDGDSDSDDDDEGKNSNDDWLKRMAPPAKKARTSAAAPSSIRTTTKKKQPSISCDYMINRRYRMQWDLLDGIRELVQNTLDGAFVYANARLSISSPMQLHTMGPLVRMKKPPKVIGLQYGYEVLFILSAETKKRKKKTGTVSPYFVDWTKDNKAVACIRCFYGIWNKFDKKDIVNGYLPESLLYSFEAENRAIDFDIRKVLTLGETSKWNCSVPQAGKFGEGLKVGAVAILRDDFKLEIQGNGKRCRFEFRRNRLTRNFTLRGKLLQSTKRYTEDAFPELVGAKITRSRYVVDYSPFHDEMITKDRNLGGIEIRFPSENFRVLSTRDGAPVGKTFKGELLLTEQEKGRVYCKAIFVEKKEHLLFGYDFQDLNLPMERNYVNHEELLVKAGKLLIDLLLESDLEDVFKKKVKDAIMEMLETKHCRDVVEAQVLYDDDDEYDPDLLLAKEIARYFDEIHGSHSFPCDESQKDDVSERLPGRSPHVVSETFLHILKRGGYRSLKDEEDSLYTEKNKTQKPLREHPFSIIVAKALSRIASAGVKGVSRAQIVFLQEKKLPRTRSECKKKEDVFYINDRLLRGKDVRDESFMIAFHLINTIGNVDALTAFMRDRNKADELEFEVRASSAGPHAIDVALSQALHHHPEAHIVLKEFDAAANGPVAIRNDCSDSKSSAGPGIDQYRSEEKEEEKTHDDGTGMDKATGHTDQNRTMDCDEEMSVPIEIVAVCANNGTGMDKATGHTDQNSTMDCDEETSIPIEIVAEHEKRILGQTTWHLIRLVQTTSSTGRIVLSSLDSGFTV